LRGYPDDATVLGQVERMLGAFDRRGDLRRHRRALADSGIAGTAITFRFFAPTAAWLAGRWGDHLTIDWKKFKGEAELERLLPILAHYSETPGLDEWAFSAREWVERLKGPAETDAFFLVRRFQALRAGSFLREKLYDGLDFPLRLAPGPDTPSRSRAKLAAPAVVYQARPLCRERPDLRAEARRAPLAARAAGPREADRLIDLAREAMVTRKRDLDVFSYADRRDVRLVDCGQGLQFACFGAIPERRLLLEAVYGFLTLQNGVPIGYALTSALFSSVDVAYNVFETYRGAEAGRVFGRLLGTIRHLFGGDAFTIHPFQLGQGNPEGIQSGAWWFYQKMGFRPHDRDTIRLMRAELRRMRRRPGYRSSPATLEKLAGAGVFFFLGDPRPDVLGRLELGDVGLCVSRYLAARFGADREGADRICSRDAVRLLAVRSTGDFSPGERLAWERWAPLVLTLPGVERWSRAERRALVGIVRAKGGRRESDFVARFDAHQPLRRAVVELAESDPH
jgi:hypothetical protein